MAQEDACNTRFAYKLLELKLCRLRFYLGGLHKQLKLKVADLAKM